MKAAQRKVIKLTMIFTLLFSLLSPVASIAETSQALEVSDIQLMKVEQLEEGVHISFQTVNSEQKNFEEFFIEVNDNSVKFNPSLLEENSLGEGLIVKKYTFLHTDVPDEGTQTYVISGIVNGEVVQSNEVSIQEVSKNVEEEILNEENKADKSQQEDSIENVREVDEDEGEGFSHIDNIKVTSKTENSFTIAWESQDVISGYTYEIYLDGELKDTLGYNSNEYTFSGLEPGTLYYVNLRLFDENNNSVFYMMNLSAKTESIPEGEIVNFTSEGLEKAIREELSIYHRDLHVSDMESLVWLPADFRDITDLSGLEYAINLEYVYLNGNGLTDIEPITSLKNIRTLTLNDNNISNLDQITKITSLYELDLSLNPIDNLAGLEKLDLEILDLRDTDISDISVLLELKGLTYVNLINTNLQFVEGTPDMEIVQTLRDRGVEVVTKYENHDSELLFWTWSSNNSIDLEWEYLGEEVVSYYELYVNGNYLYTTADTFYQLEDLVSGSEYLIEVIAYNEADEQIVSSYVYAYTQSEGYGEVIQFEDKQLEQAIRDELWIYHREITKGDMLDLYYLSAYNIGITSLNGLEYAHNLERLYLDGNEIQDISVLNNLTQLRYISLDDNNIENIDVLLELTNLFSVDLMENPIDVQPGTDAFNVLMGLIDRGVNVYQEEINKYKPIVLYVNTVHESGISFTWDYYGYGRGHSHYELYVNGQFIEEIDSYTWEYTIRDLEATTVFSITLKAIGDNGEDLTEGSIEVETLDMPSGEIVSFNDENLESLVQRTLGIYHRDIYSSDMLRLEYIWDMGDPISDLSGLEYAQNVVSIELTSGNLSDLSPLSNLNKLEQLYLGWNNIEDITPLLSLDNLFNLSIAYNPVKDIAGIEELADSLKYLYLHGTEITTIDNLLLLPNLEVLGLQNTLKLEKYEGSNALDIIEQLEENGVYVYYENIIHLWMYVDDVTANSASVIWDTIGSHNPTYKLLLNGEYYTTVSNENSFVFENLTEGEGYEITIQLVDNDDNVLAEDWVWVTPYGDHNEGPGEGDVVSFEDQSLEEAIRYQLSIFNRELTTGDLERLTYLYASSSNIYSLEGLQYAVNLEEANLSHNNIIDVTPLQNLTKLKDLSLWNNQITSVEPLRLLTDLIYLDLDVNNITDATPLEGMNKLTVLWLANNPISDISVVEKLNSLEDLYLYGIPLDLSEGSITLQIIEKLIDRGVHVGFDGYIENELYIYSEEIKENSIEISWWTNIFNVLEYQIFVNGDLVATVDNLVSNYKIASLASNTEYEITVVALMENGQRFARLYERTLLPADEYVEVRLVAKDKDDVSVINNLSFSFYGIDEVTSNEYRYGYTNTNGVLREWNRPSGIHMLPVGKYEVVLYDHRLYEEAVVEFEVEKGENYLENPIVILLEKKVVEIAEVELSVVNSNGEPVTALEYISFYSSKTVSTHGYGLGYYSNWDLHSEDGVYKIPSIVFADDYQLSVQASGYVAFNEQQISVNGDTIQLHVQLEEGAKVRAQLVDVNNNPLIGASFYAYGNNTWVYGETISEGKIELNGLKQERITLDISMPSYQSKQIVIEASDFENDLVNLGTIQLLPETFVHGKVVNEDLVPVRNANVYLYEGTNSWSSYWGRTDANGYFKINNVPVGQQFTLKTEAYNLPSAERVVEANETEYTIMLEKPATGSFVGEGNSFTANKQTVTPGSDIEYRINYKNNGEDTSEELQVSFVLPEGVTVLSDSISIVLDGNKMENVIRDNTITISNVGPGKGGFISFKARANSSLEVANLTASARFQAGENVTNLTATTNVVFATLQAPQATASSTLKVYGAARVGSEVEIYDGNVLVGKTTAQSRWWYADVTLRTEAGVASTHQLTAKVIKDGHVAFSSPVTVEYNPTIPTVTDVTIDAGWNQDIKLNPYTGVATFAIVEFTPINVEIKFDMDIKEGNILFLGEKYLLVKTGDVYTANIPGTWSSYGEQMFELEFKVNEQFVRLPLMEVLVLIDPSGYVFEGSMDYRLQGVTAQVFEKRNNRWESWNAEFFGGQINPQVTDEDGRYGWDVPEGDWKVVWTKDGYETYESRVVTVPPAETELNVPLIRSYDPIIQSITPNDNATEVELDSSITVVFDRLMSVEYIEQFIKVFNKDDDSEVTVEYQYVSYNGYKETVPNSGYFVEDNSKLLFKEVTLVPEIALAANSTYRIEVSGLMEDYAGKTIGETVEQAFTTVHAEGQEPGEGEGQEPGEGEGQEPGEDEVQEPGEGEVQEPGEGEGQEPGEGEVQEPGEGEGQEPGEGEGQEPGEGEGQEPGEGEGQEPAKEKNKEKNDKQNKTKSDNKDQLKKDKKENSKLPKTASNILNLLSVGLLLIIVGLLSLLYYKRREA